MGTGKEPILTVAAVVAIGGLIVSGLSVWGIALTPDQEAWAARVIAVLAPLVVWAVSRQWTTPTAKVEQKVEQARSEERATALQNLPTMPGGSR